MIEPWQLAVGLVAAATLGVAGGVCVGPFLLSNTLRSWLAHYKGEAERNAGERRRADRLEADNRQLREDAAVLRRMQQPFAVLADRLADAEEALAETKGGYSRLMADFRARAAAEADRLAELRVADLHERLIEYSRQVAKLAVENGELLRRCGEAEDSDLDTELTPE